MKKIKVLTLSDHPLSPSGVGIQTKYMIEALLSTGRYQIISFGGAVRHRDYKPVTTEEWGQDWVIYPVDGYGNQEMIRSALRGEKPDIVWFMTDPRFYSWLWDIENEVRPLAPMIYYHVWDNYPYPKYNKVWYDSNDTVVSISRLTNDVVKNVAPDVDLQHIPHAVDSNIFKRLNPSQLEGARKKHGLPEDKIIFFWNNRNARRKQSGSLIYWFKDFLDKVGHDKACLLMHTEVKDPNGQDLEAIIRELDLTEGQVMFSQQKLPFESMSVIYNMVDCTVNISDAEGFGLATLESLACGTPIIVNMTGGLQEQVTDGKEWFGIGIEPASKAVIGSQEIPWIREDRINGDDLVNALEKIYNMSHEERVALGEKGMQHVSKNYSFKGYCEKWVNLMDETFEKKGSWENRKNYQSWRLMEL